MHRVTARVENYTSRTNAVGETLTQSGRWCLDLGALLHPATARHTETQHLDTTGPVPATPPPVKECRHNEPTHPQNPLKGTPSPVFRTGVCTHLPKAKVQGVFYDTKT